MLEILAYSLIYDYMVNTYLFIGYGGYELNQI